MEKLKKLINIALFLKLIIFKNGFYLLYKKYIYSIIELYKKIMININCYYYYFYKNNIIKFRLFILS